MPRLRDIFRRKPRATLARFEVSGQGGTFTAYHGDPWANDVFRSGVDSIARICAKFVLQPVAEFSDGTTASCDDELARILQVRPNGYQTAYDFLYQLVAILYTRNNSYCYIKRDELGRVRGLYVLHVSLCEIVEDSTGRLFAALTFANGQSYTLPYADIIHLRRHMNQRDVLGDSPSPVDAGVSLAESINEGVKRNISTGGHVKGLLTVPGALGDTQLNEFRRQFEATYLSPDNVGGIIASDASFTYTPFDFTEQPVITDADQRAAKEKIYNYLGVSESIVNGTFDDETFGAFEESTIEALALQIALELTAKVYGDASKRRIECRTNRIRFIGNQAKNNLLKNLLPMGALSLNEARDLLGLQPLESDRMIQSLNYSNVEIVDQYQISMARGGKIKSLSPQEGKEGAGDE